MHSMSSITARLTLTDVEQATKASSSTKIDSPRAHDAQDEKTLTISTFENNK
jgi:hypothetical protein